MRLKPALRDVNASYCVELMLYTNIQYVLTYAWSDVWLTPSVSGTRNSVAGINHYLKDFKIHTGRNMTSYKAKTPRIKPSYAPVKWTTRFSSHKIEALEFIVLMIFWISGSRPFWFTKYYNFLILNKPR